MNSNSNAVAIVNRFAGHSRARIDASSLAQRIPGNVHIVATETTQQAEELAFQHSLDGTRLVVAVGGDGSVHAVANGLLRNPQNETHLGVIAAGTANDYADGLHAYRQRLPDSDLAVDVGHARWDTGERYFVNVAGTGLPARVAAHALDLCGWPARVRYTWALARAAMRGLASQRTAIHIDDQPVQSTDDALLMFSLAIGPREGSFALASQASFDDGFVDYLRVTRLNAWDLIKYFPRVLRGSIPTHDPRITVGTCRSLRLTAEAAIPVHLDGELIQGSHSDYLFVIQPRRLCVELF